MKYLSVFHNDTDILLACNDIFLKGKWYDLDCTYSKGIFWKSVQQPRLKSDLYPQFNDVIKSDSQKLDFIENNSISSIVFDPPFLFRNRKSPNHDKMSKRFSYFQTYAELITMYSNSLSCFYNKLQKKRFCFL